MPALAGLFGTAGGASSAAAGAGAAGAGASSAAGSSLLGTALKGAATSILGRAGGPLPEGQVGPPSPSTGFLGTIQTGVPQFGGNMFGDLGSLAALRLVGTSPMQALQSYLSSSPGTSSTMGNDLFSSGQGQIMQLILRRLLT